MTNHTKYTTTLAGVLAFGLLLATLLAMLLATASADAAVTNPGERRCCGTA